ncbi:MAG: HAD-IC family P-type ATPase [Actinomycetia bacterium]|nr:HAD-IC family P-type ATPase [Actinomycetes bacterium]
MNERARGAALRGLTAAEVVERVAAGQVNQVPAAPSRTLAQIVRANVFTPVNAIIGSLFVLVMIASPGPDALFAGVVISNSTIGIIQELRAKRTLDRLAVLSSPKARVIRDGDTHELAVDQVVLDDLLALTPGDQIVVDGLIESAVGLEADESLLTGESDPVDKTTGDRVLSGSFVAAGSGLMRADRIGAESYASTLAEEARRFQLAHSELKRGIDLILRWLTWIIPPVSVVLLWSLWRAEDTWQEALRGVVAAAVAMVPDGLVLLTSISLIVGVLALARRHALAKELASIELLARVDTLCLDKTGTITTGDIVFADLRILHQTELTTAREALGALAGADPSPNPTMAAIAARHPDPGWPTRQVVPFSSARKWSGVMFTHAGSWVLGAPEMLVGDRPDVSEALDTATRAGHRVVLLARSDRDLVDADGQPVAPPDLDPVALVLLEDEVRADAVEILEYFRLQGVDLKVISGDHPDTVAAVARRAGLQGAHSGYDARQLPEDQADLADTLEHTSVFGRVTPHQKRAMVHALQDRGRIVAMTGDGVNDVLALKDADMGIAMGSGSASTRAVAQLVLLDDSFATLPRVVSEGRRVITNIERVANLFVAKAAYAVMLAFLVGIAQVPFLFLPRQLTLVGTFSIGVPGFFLALEATERRARSGFIGRVLRFAVPAGVVAGLVTFAVYEWSRRHDAVTLAEARTAATAVLLAIGLIILIRLSRPLNLFRAALVSAMAASLAATLTVPWLQTWFALDPPPAPGWWAVAAGTVAAAAALVIGPRLLPFWAEPEPFSIPPARAEPPERNDSGGSL